MLPMPSGLSGRYCWSVTIVHVASHMNMFETSSETEYRFQSCCSSDRRQSARSMSRSIGTSTGSSSVALPVKTWYMYRPSSVLVAIVNRMVNATARYSVLMEAQKLLPDAASRSTRYTNAATLNNNDRRVMSSPIRGHRTSTKASIAANVTIPRTTIPNAKHRVPPRTRPPGRSILKPMPIEPMHRDASPPLNAFVVSPSARYFDAAVHVPRAEVRGSAERHRHYSRRH